MKRLPMTLLVGTIIASSLAPFAAYASPLAPEPQSRHRKQKQDEWKTLGIASGVAALLGLLKKDGTITFLGTAGALYSAYRYEEDRKSSDRERRARAEMFSRPSFTRNGVRYDRRVVYKGKKKYYQFVRHDRNRHG